MLKKKMLLLKQIPVRAAVTRAANINFPVPTRYGPALIGGLWVL